MMISLMDEPVGSCRIQDPWRFGSGAEMPHQMRGATCATLILLASSAVATDTLSYPTPPNPFATPKPPPGDAPLPHPPSLDELRPSLPPGAAPKAKAKRHWRPRWQPVLCLAALSAVCVQTRPGEASLLTAIDEYHQEAGSLIDSSLRGMETGFREMGVGSIAVHSELVWLGMLGMWLPLVPITKDAIAHWLPVASAHQLIVSALTVGYLLRKLLPRSLAEALFSVSFSNIARLRLWTPLTAAFSPMGLVHWLHAVVVLLAVMPALGGSFSRNEQLLLYAGAGAASSLACVIMQLLFRRRAQPRSSVRRACHAAAVGGLGRRR